MLPLAAFRSRYGVNDMTKLTIWANRMNEIIVLRVAIETILF